MLNKYTISFLALLMLTACSSDNAENKENTTEKITQEIGAKAVAAIQDPLDKARQAAKTAEEHSRQIKEYEQRVEK
jgi:uncharacterized protein YcfL